MTVTACPTCNEVGEHYPGCPDDPDRKPPTRDYAHNPHAESARRLKAAFLMDALKAADIPPSAARLLQPEQRRTLEKAAVVRRSSDETWDLAISLLEQEVKPAPDTAVERIRAFVAQRSQMRNLDPEEINSVWASGFDRPAVLTMTDLRELIRLATREETP